MTLITRSWIYLSFDQSCRAALNSGTILARIPIRHLARKISMDILFMKLKSLSHTDDWLTKLFNARSGYLPLY